MSLDVGSKTIGVAVSDPMGWTAQGITTLERKGLDADLAVLRSLLEEYEVERIIVGLPLSMDGSEGSQARFVREFAVSVEKRFPHIPLELWDERLSTVGAERSLLEADLSRAKRKKVIDKMAAVFILQGYLDVHAGGGDS